jgi:rsbT antagonist protein RsbS
MQELIMDAESASLEIGTSVVRGCLVVPIQMELYDDMIHFVQKSILKKVEDAGVKAVVIDLSAVRVLDAFAFEAFVNTARMVSLLGATTILVGIQAGVASALVDLDMEFGGIRTALSLEDAFEQQEPSVSHSAELEVMEGDVILEKEIVEKAEHDGEERDV